MKHLKPRMTHQREIILRALRSVTSHPTADEMYAMVREHLPHISIASVYRNLEWLAEKGFVQKIEVGGRQKRFDGTTTVHYHVRCHACGKVADVAMTPFTDIDRRVQECTGYHITGHHIAFSGLCPQCQHSSTENK